MRRVKSLIAAGAASLLSTTAFAADYPPPPPIAPPPPPPYYAPPPPQEFGGWYLRGDIGMTNQKVKSLQNILNNDPGVAVQPVHYEFDSGVTFGLGIGYQYNSWLRFDVTGEYRGKTSFNGLEIIRFNGGIIGTDEYRGNKSEWLGLVNAYADLGTFWCITPFVGAGIGYSRNEIRGFTDINTPNGGVAFAQKATKTNFAYALHAGLAYKVTNNFTIELAYRYLNLGDGITGDLQTFDGLNARFNPTTFKDITSNDLRLGVRWNLEPTLVAPPPPPPLLAPLIRRG